MKNKISFLFFLFCTILSYAQNQNEDDIIYLDSIKNKTTKEKHRYYRIVKKLIDNELYEVKDYYQSGALQMDGSSLSKDHLVKVGNYIYYHENGNKKRTEYYNKKLVGKCEEWYENGTKNLEEEDLDSDEIIKNYKINQYWDSNGQHTVVDGNGFYDSRKNKSFENGYIKNGFKDGLWKGESNNSGSLKYQETYKKGKLITGLSIDSNNIEYKYEVLEIKPEPKKGIRHFYEYLGQTIKIPKGYENIKGKILIQFAIDEEGKVTEPKIIKSLHPTLDQEALRVLMSYPKWSPAIQRGKTIKIRYSVPIQIA